MLSNVVGAKLERSIAYGTILNDDVPLVSVANETVAESASSVTFTLKLHEPGVEEATVTYATKVIASKGDAAATPGEDFTTTAGTLKIPVGDTSATITVPLLGDSTDEVDESFLLELSSATKLALRDSAAVATVTDDDDGWHIADASVAENAGPLEFTVTRDHTSAAAVTVNYTVTGVGATAGTSCTSGVDYVTPSGSVTLQPADTTATISITLCDDTASEGSEGLLVELTGITGRRLSATGTITDND